MEGATCRNAPSHAQAGSHRIVHDRRASHSVASWKLEKLARAPGPPMRTRARVSGMACRVAGSRVRITADQRAASPWSVQREEGTSVDASPVLDSFFPGKFGIGSSLGRAGPLGSMMPQRMVRVFDIANQEPRARTAPSDHLWTRRRNSAAQRGVYGGADEIENGRVGEGAGVADPSRWRIRAVWGC